MRKILQQNLEMELCLLIIQFQHVVHDNVVLEVSAPMDDSNSSAVQ